MSTYALHHSALERRRVMLQKLGGDAKRREAIDIFYKKQMEDERLLNFFEGTDIEIIKWHQFNLMSIAFTAVPRTFDVSSLLLTRHRSLFDAGLDESHFDIVAKHFTDTLEEMNVDAELIKEALDVVTPLRNIFQEGARQAKKRKETAEFRGRLKKLVFVAIAAALMVRYARQNKK
ncbi:Group 1 truncated hemoglobin [Seminavis robusta]|uniref:Group 1 truncated hemoglobin n=1 Tax=Seminavis robusta TaxID=568900 RepID=A0A9N8HYY4_9STRA|nr:Group 1 truncated hemoglobin [Seminavis robusta]|eukprot:Sro3085_g343410.1 Group 1 truncated hemoglobin (176) ;mRNA; r:4798-5325